MPALKISKRQLQDCVKDARARLPQHEGEFKHFSYVFQSRRLLGWGRNKMADPFPGFGYTRTLHAENEAWRRSRHALTVQPWLMVNIRLSTAGDLRMSMPCDCCQAFLGAMGCQMVYYSTDYGFRELRL